MVTRKVWITLFVEHCVLFPYVFKEKRIFPSLQTISENRMGLMDWKVCFVLVSDALETKELGNHRLDFSVRVFQGENK